MGTMGSLWGSVTLCAFNSKTVFPQKLENNLEGEVCCIRLCSEVWTEWNEGTGVKPNYARKPRVRKHPLR